MKNLRVLIFYSSMTTKFFTNEEGRTLIEKIEGVFQHKKIHYWDILVGYFRASGYFGIRPFVQSAVRSVSA